jgi:hypothetical protein
MPAGIPLHGMAFAYVHGQSAAVPGSAEGVLFEGSSGTGTFGEESTGSALFAAGRFRVSSGGRLPAGVPAIQGHRSLCDSAEEFAQLGEKSSIELARIGISRIFSWR